jgi:uncharacterized protein (TIGR02145 family)
MKQYSLSFLLLTLLTGIGNFCYAQGRVVQISHIAADYAANPPTVTFDVYWDTNPDRSARHLDTVWVFVDYQPVTGNSTGAWQHANITNAIANIANGTGNIVAPGIINGRGFFLYGSAAPFRAKLTVTLSSDLAGARFNWCAYATDYPPNAIPDAAGYYTLHGTPPFIVNGDTLASGERTFTGCISILTDATGCPGLIPTSPAITSFTAAPTTVCAGEEITLAVVATNADAYSFDGGNNWTPSSDTTFVPAASGAYTIHARNVAGCIATYSPDATVTVNPRPAITSFTAAPTTVCAGDSITLTVVATGANRYSFDGGNNWTPSSDTTFVPAASGAYTVHARNADGCVATYPTDAPVTVHPRPAAGFVTLPPTTACAGSTVTLTGSGGGSYCFTQICDNCIRNPYFSGNDDEGAVDCDIPVLACSYTLTNTYTFVMPESGNVTVWMWVKNEHECIDSISAMIAVSGAPPAISHLSGHKNPSVESGVAITPIVYKTVHASGATCTGLPSGVTSTWNGSNETLTIAGTPVVGGAYTYTLQTENNNGCANASDSGIITVAGPILYAGCAPPSLALTGIGFTDAATYSSNGLIISAPVTVTTCDKTGYYGTVDGAGMTFTADCRNNTLPEYGHIYSWCMVKQYESLLCPSPWRVPTREDYCMFLTNAVCNNSSVTNEQKVGIYGWLASGRANGENSLSAQGSVGLFWTSTDEGIDGTMWYAYIIGVYDTMISVASSSHEQKANALSLRCVQNAP